jgi:YjjG family noncanonical pyrimidine nucleotidase
MTKRYDWLLFDADNTLFDFHRCEGQALQLAMEDIGLSFVPKHHDLYRQINIQCWQEYERRIISKEELRLKRFLLFFDAVQIEADPETFGTGYLQHLSTAAFLLEGALELLEQLKSNYRLALVTNGLKEVQRPRLEAGALNPFFEAIIVSDEIGYAKPHRPFFDYTFQEIGSPDKDKVLIIGDNLHADVKGGLDYGIHACWYNPEAVDRTEDVEPTYEIRSLGELEGILSGENL